MDALMRKSKLALTKGKKGIFPICFPFFGTLCNFAHICVCILTLNAYIMVIGKKREGMVFYKDLFWWLMRMLKKFHQPWSMIV
jgi:hypothetical protein